jgi:hypothetical protein
MRRRSRLVLCIVTGLVATAVVPLSLTSGAQAGVGISGTTRTIQKGAAITPRSNPAGSGAFTSVATELPKSADPDASTAGLRSNGSDRSLTRSHHAATPEAAGPVTASSAVVRTGPKLNTSFQGLNLRDQRLANGGNQFTVEPPDQALCVGGGHVVEAVNDVVRSFTTAGAPETGVIDLNTFFGYPAQFDRTTGAQGPFVTDPSCLFDPTTNTFFLTVLTLEVVPSTGAFTGDNHLDIAVFTNPVAGPVNVYRVDVTDDGTFGTPVHPGCPCIGDYPHIGVDANGFYVTTNEYPFFTDGFVGAQIYAFSKSALASGAATVQVTQFDTSTADQGSPGFTVWPAQSPDASQYATADSGTEFFLSSNAAEEVTGTAAHQSTSIVKWALTNTASVNSDPSGLSLASNRITVDSYSPPPPANQKPGSVPLADCLNLAQCSKFLLGKPNKFKESESVLDSNDTRMQQVTYTGGKLTGALDTAATVGGANRAGIAYYVVSGAGNTLLKQGRLALSGNNVTYPAIGIASSGKGILSFTLVGNDFFPSAAFTSFDTTNGAGPILVAQAGAGPQDGFTGYKAFGNPPRPRWGDYGATAVGSGGTLWVAAEYIGQTCTLAQYTAAPFGSCGGTRVTLGNWSTRVSQIQP